MLYILGAGIAVTVVVIGVIFWKKVNTPSAEVYDAIEKAVKKLQSKAKYSVISAENGSDNAGLDEDCIALETETVQNIIKLVYTIQQAQNEFLHTFSSQLVCNKNRKYHIECMLVMMLVLQRELEEAGIKPDDVEFQVDQSGFGTQYLYMLLDSDQQDRFSQQIKVESPPVKVPRTKQTPKPCVPEVKKAGKNKLAYTWIEPPCEKIPEPFTNENLKYLLEDGSKECNAEYTHQQIADWCRLWGDEDHNDRMDVPREILDLIEDVDMQWDMYLSNTYSFDELAHLDLSQVCLPIEWFINWAAKLKDFMEQLASANRR